MSVPVRKLFSVFAVLSTINGTASAQEIEPLPSAFAGLNWSVSDVPLDLDILNAMAIADPSARLKQFKWNAKKGIGERQQYLNARLGRDNINGITDKTTVEATHWHSGQMIWKVEKTWSSPLKVVHQLG